jgi:hypothetical protein
MTLLSGNTTHDAPLLNADTVPYLDPYVFARSCYAKNAIRGRENEIAGHLSVRTLLTIRYLNSRKIVAPATSKVPTIAPAPKDNIAGALSA